MYSVINANIGETYVIKRIGGNPEIKEQLENLGFTVGGNVNVVKSFNGHLIADVQGTLIGISKEIAHKILV